MLKVANRLMLVSGLGLFLVGVSACHNGDRPMGQAINDRMTEHDVHRALAKAPVYKFPDVRANVFDGNVQLTGYVETTQQRQEAAEIASRVQGVRQVVNDIMLKPTPTGRATIREGTNGRVDEGNPPPVGNEYTTNNVAPQNR